MAGIKHKTNNRKSSVLSSWFPKLMQIHLSMLQMRWGESLFTGVLTLGSICPQVNMGDPETSVTIFKRLTYVHFYRERVNNSKWLRIILIT